jgi:hypothetical protein
MIDEANNGHSIRNVYLFPDKIGVDLHGCRVVALTFDYFPFISRSGLIENDETSYGVGFMVPLLRVLSEQLVQHIDKVSEASRGGERLKNGSWNGVTNELICFTTFT